jgi:hypothetical protein
LMLDRFKHNLNLVHSGLDWGGMLKLR